jgi:hypothetical protein
MARGPVIQFSSVPEDRHGQVLRDELQRTIGRITAHATIPLHSNYAGTTITLAGGTATAAAMATSVDLSDGGLDLHRVVVYGTPPANDVQVQVYNVTTGQVVATATMKGGAPAGLFTGAWTGVTPKGGDEQLQVRFVGTGVQAPVVNAIHLQAASNNVKP